MDAWTLCASYISTYRKLARELAAGHLKAAEVQPMLDRIGNEYRVQEFNYKRCRHLYFTARSKRIQAMQALTATV